MSKVTKESTKQGSKKAYPPKPVVNPNAAVEVPADTQEPNAAVEVPADTQEQGMPCGFYVDGKPVKHNMMRVEMLRTYSYLRSGDKVYFETPKAARLIEKGVCKAVPLKTKKSK